MDWMALSLFGLTSWPISRSNPCDDSLYGWEAQNRLGNVRLSHGATLVPQPHRNWATEELSYSQPAHSHTGIESAHSHSGTTQELSHSQPLWYHNHYGTTAAHSHGATILNISLTFPDLLYFAILRFIVHATWLTARMLDVVNNRLV